jgi:hypothetical protein
MNRASAPRSGLGDPAVRDAEAILERVAKDENDAIVARARYWAFGLPTVEPDTHIAGHLDVDERLVAMRPTATVERVGARDGRHSPPMSGRLYVTTRRLLMIGRPGLTIDLEEVEELGVAGERLLVSLGDGGGLTIDAARPRHLRVLIGAARAALRPSIGAYEVGV